MAIGWVLSGPFASNYFQYESVLVFSKSIQGGATGALHFRECKKLNARSFNCLSGRAKACSDAAAEGRV